MNYTNKYHLPASIADALRYDDYDLEPITNVVSCTTLISPIRQKVLQRRYVGQITEDVSDHVWLLFGKANHYILETSAKGKERLVEERWFMDTSDWSVTTMPIGGKISEQPWYKANHWYISGKLDSYDPAEKSLNDFKVTTVWSYVYEGGNAKPEHVAQLAINGMAMRKLGFAVETHNVIAIYRDYNKNQAKQTYPDLLCPIAILPCTIWDDITVRAYAGTRIRQFRDNLNKPDTDLVICSSEERWAKTDKYAVMQKDRKRATRVLDTENEAKELIEKLKAETGNIYSIEFRKGADIRCEGYCNVCQWCDYGKKYFNQ